MSAPLTSLPSAEAVHDYVAKHVNQTAGKVAGLTVALAWVAGGLYVIGFSALSVVQFARGASLPAIDLGSWSVVLSAALALLAAVTVWNRSKAETRRQIAACRMEDIVPLAEQLDRVEAERRAHTQEHFGYLVQRLDGLDVRVRSLEDHTDIAGLRQQLIDQLSRQHMADAGYSPTIEYAYFGLAPDPKQASDVTDRLREILTRDGKIDIVVGPRALRVDPYIGQPKQLFVRYSFNGAKAMEVAVPESEKLVIP